MHHDRDDHDRPHRVVRNAEDQHSVWPADTPPPSGWTATGPPATRAECLAQVRLVWTDQRPASLRARTEA